MRFKISKDKLEQVKDTIQKVLDSELNSLREESNEWGLGEMHELEQIESVKKIKVERIVPYMGTKVYIKIFSTKDEDYDYQDLRAELQYRINDWFPNVELYIDEIIS